MEGSIEARTGNYPKSVADPSHTKRLLSDPFARTERKADHEQCSDKFMTERLQVFATLDEGRRQRQEESGGNERYQVSAERRNLLDYRLHHDSLFKTCSANITATCSSCDFIVLDTLTAS